MGRLRSGELITGAGAVVLAIALFALQWYDVKPPFVPADRLKHVDTSITGFHEFTHLRWLIVLTIVAGLALVVLQAASRAPAVPSSFSAVVIVLGALTSLWLIYRVLLSVPGHGDFDQQPAAYVGLASALVLTGGAYASLRQEDRPDPVQNAEIPVVKLGSET